jgi:hypothetical protein
MAIASGSPSLGPVRKVPGTSGTIPFSCWSAVADSDGLAFTELVKTNTIAINRVAKTPATTILLFLFI